MESIDSLRRRAKALQRNTGSKISRLEKSGLSIRGTDFDPRKPIVNIDRYNRSQLNSHIERLKEFNRRDSLARAPIGRTGNVTTIAKWQSFKRQEKRLNQQKLDVFNVIKDVEVAQTGMTVAEALSLLPGGAERVKRMGTNMNSSLMKTNKKAKNIENLDSKLQDLYKIANDAKKMIEKSNEITMLSVEGMLEKLEAVDKNGVDKLRAAMKKLNPAELFILTSATPHFIGELALKYKIYTSGKDDPYEGIDEATAMAMKSAGIVPKYEVLFEDELGRA